MRPENCADGGYLVYQYKWIGQNQYRAVPGKYVGVMVDGVMSRNQNYRTQYACTMVLVGDPSLIPQLHSYGYSLDSIIIGLNPANYQQSVNSAVSQGVKRFYIDEPIHNGYQQFVQAAAPYIAAQGGRLTISESEFNYSAWYYEGDKGNIGAMIDLALSCYPRPFVCCHTHFEYHKVLGITLTLDPRDQWTYIMGRVPTLFQMAIIKSRQSDSEMGLLWGHANNIGIHQILLYPFQADGVTYAGVQNAIIDGHDSQWDQLYLLQQRQEWCCPTIYFYGDQCTFKTQYYTGASEWN